MLFEELGFCYLGPVDGHNIEQLEDIFNKAKAQEGPVLVHVLTKKGKGYIPAEENPDKFHSTSSFELLTGESKKEKIADYSKIFGETLVKLAKQNEKIVAITAAMKDGTGLAEFSKQFPNRFFDVGIAEQHSLTMAAGMAKEGLIPVVSIYSSFYQRAYDQVIHDIAMQNLPVVLCIDRAGIVGNDGETHQGIFDMAFLNLVPNLTIMAPKNFEELKQMLEYAVNLKAPVAIRYPRGGEDTEISFEKGNAIKESINYEKNLEHSENNINSEENLEHSKNNINSEESLEHSKNNMNSEESLKHSKNNMNSEESLKNNKNNISNKIIETGKAEIIKEGQDISILALGKMVAKAQKVANILEEHNINAAVINARFLKPLDETTIINSVSKTNKIITIEDGILRGGLATSTLEVLEKNGIANSFIKPYGYPDEFIKHGKVEELEKLYGLDEQTIANELMEKVQCNVIA